MSDFKVKMHQIRFRLGLRPKPRWGSLERSPDSRDMFRPLGGMYPLTRTAYNPNRTLGNTPPEGVFYVPYRASAGMVWMTVSLSLVWKMSVSPTIILLHF